MFWELIFSGFKNNRWEVQNSGDHLLSRILLLVSKDFKVEIRPGYESKSFFSDEKIIDNLMNPSKIYETERLFLRPTAIEDAAFIYELLNTPKWLQFIGDRNVNSVEEAEQYIIDKMLPQLERLGFSNNTVIRKEDGTKIGTCGLYDREGVEGLDIGFAFLPQYEKQGYGFEAASRILRFAREDLRVENVAGITSRENLASQKLLKKLGLKFCQEINVTAEAEKVFLFRLPVEEK